MAKRESGVLLEERSTGGAGSNNIKTRVCVWRVAIRRRAKHFKTMSWRRQHIVCVLSVLVCSICCHFIIGQATETVPDNSFNADNRPGEQLVREKRIQADTNKDRKNLLGSVPSSQTTIPAANPNFEAAFQGECASSASQSSNPCEHICLDLHDGTYECACFYGFTLAVDGYSCARLAPGPQTSPSPVRELQTAAFGGGASSGEPSSKPEASRAPGAMRLGGAGADTNDLRAQSSGDSLVPAQTNSNDGSLAASAHENPNESHDSRQDVVDRPFGQPSSSGLNDRRKWGAEPISLVRAPPAHSASLGPSNLVFDGGPKSSGPEEQQPETPAPAAATTIITLAYAGDDANGPNETNMVTVERPQTRAPTTKAISGSGPASGRRTNGNSAKASLARTANDKWLKYDVDTRGPRPAKNRGGDEGDDFAGTQQTNGIEPSLRFLIHRRQENQPQDQDDDDELDDVDSDVRSIMLANDKLVGHFERSIEASIVQQERQAPIDRHADPPTDQWRRPIVGKLTKGAEKQNDNKRRLDYDLSLLESLVDKTIEDYGRVSVGKLELGRSNESDEKINEASAKAIGSEENRSSDERQRQRRLATCSSFSCRRPRQSQEMSEPPTPSPPLPLYKIEDGRVDNEEQLGDGFADRGGGKKQMVVSLPSIISKSTAKLNRNDDDGANYDDDDDGDGGSSVGVGVGVGDDDDDDQKSQNELSNDDGVKDNNHEPMGDFSGLLNQERQTRTTEMRFKSCSEMPECESGGECVEETKLVSKLKSDLVKSERQARCRCPIGRGGRLCQKRYNFAPNPTKTKTAIQRSVPKFSSQSYLALPMTSDRLLSDLRLVFKPQTNLDQNDMTPRSSLLLYSKKFALLLDPMNRVELRYLQTKTFSNASNASRNKEVTRVIGSRDAHMNEWNELIITDSSSDDTLEVTEEDNNNGEEKYDKIKASKMNKIVLITPDKIQLEGANNNNIYQHEQNDSTFTQLFVGGLPDSMTKYTKGDTNGNKNNNPTNTSDKSDARSRHWILSEQSSACGFTGCIMRLQLSGRDYNLKSDLNGDALDGFDIGECVDELE